MTIFGYEAQRFDLRFLRTFRADLSIRKSSSFFPRLIAATSHLGFAHGLPKSRLMDLDTSAGPSFPSMRFHRLAQPFGLRLRRSTAFQVRPDACAAFHQPAFAGP